jgi:hypothetical protein
VHVDLVQLGAAVLSGGAIQWAISPIERLFKRQAERELSREEHIAILRKALDKAGIRQNATVSVCDLLLIALELVEQLPPAAQRAKEQARHKLADVVRTLERVSGGGDGD